MANRTNRASVRKPENKCIAEQPLEDGEFFRVLLENSLSAIVVVDAEGKIRYESPSMEAVLGYRGRDRIGANGIELVHPEDMAIATETLANLVQHPERSALKEIRIRHADGSWRRFQIYGRNLLNNPAVRGIVAVFHDVTELRQREEVQREMEAWCSTLIENTKDGIDIVQDGVCKFGNKALEEITGYPIEEFVGMKMTDIVLPEYEEQTVKRFEGRLAGTVPPSYIELKIRRKDGEIRDLEASGTVIQYKGKPAIMGIIRDVTERKRVTGELRKSQEQLRNLSAHLEKVREEESKRISRMIHDDLGQMLAALKFDLYWVSSRVGENQEPLRKKIEAMLRLTDMLIERVRRISAELRPGLLDDLGLVPAIEWLANEFQSRTGIRCQLDLGKDDTVVDREHATVLFRVLQEALTNVALHSNATAVKISLRSQDGNGVLEIRDNGRGITQEQIDDPTSFGLIGMRERATLWGGDFKISGVRGEGTAVLFTIPFIKK
jgi:PAS domain S-box-containing protein